MKKPIKYVNFVLFVITLLLLVSLQSYTHLSTSLLSILPNGEVKELIRNFNQTQNSKILLLAVKGFDDEALNKINKLEKEINTLPLVSQKSMKRNSAFQEHKEAYKLYSQEINIEKLGKIDVHNELQTLYMEMTSSFFPVQIDKNDPFKILSSPHGTPLILKNGHTVLEKYGYLSYFLLQSNTLKEHQRLYSQINTIVNNDVNIKVFSPVFYYVENSQAIRSDVNKIILIATMILLLLYLLLLRDVSLLLNTLGTLGTSAMMATIVITQLYDEVSIFVFVFGISISTIAIDYMFHHYIHDFYVKQKPFNKEVLFGFLTTVSAFFILSFTSFLLIKQIALFAMISLLVSYMIFAFIYPKIGFRKFRFKQYSITHTFNFLNPKKLFLLSAILILSSFAWVHFDFNLKNLDYDNKKLKKTEKFFAEHFNANKDISFAIKANSIDALIENTKAVIRDVTTTQIPLSNLMSKHSYEQNKDILRQLDTIRNTLAYEAKQLGFKEGFFDDAYDPSKVFVPYTQEQIKSYGIDVVKIKDIYYAYGRIDKNLYQMIASYDFVESLSLKERFEMYMEESMDTLLKLGALALLLIVVLLYLITKNAMAYALLFLLFPLSMVGIYAYFTAINILHIFMLFVILAIGIDYAIYLSKKSDVLTKRAIAYSLVSTFAGFGVLIFSKINALFSMGIIATIGIVSIFILLVFVKGADHES